MAKEYEVVLKQSRACLQSMWDINAKISYALRSSDYDALLRALDERDTAIRDLAALRKKCARLNAEQTAGTGDRGDKSIILREIHRLASSLVSQGEYYIKSIEGDMREVERKLADIRRGKKVVSGYNNTGNKVRSATFTG